MTICTISARAQRSLAMVLLLVAACGGNKAAGTVNPAADAGTPSAERRTMTASPQSATTLSSSDGRLKIMVPAGAVSVPTELWVEPVPKEMAMVQFPDAIPAGVAYHLGPDGQTFAAPVDLALAMDLATVQTDKGVPVIALYSRTSAGAEELLLNAAPAGEAAPALTVVDLLGPRTFVGRRTRQWRISRRHEPRQRRPGHIRHRGA